MSSNASFWDREARRYAARPISNVDNYEHSLARTRSYLGSEDRVLEVGAGTSSTALLLAPHVGHITASDVSAEMVAIGREKAWDQSVKNISIVQGVLGDDALGSGPFDAILAHNVLHLMPDLTQDLSFIMDLLKPGGMFISKTPCLRGKRILFWPMIKVMQLFGKAPYVTFMSDQGVIDRIRNAGFEVVEYDIYKGGLLSSYVVARKPA